MCHAIVDLIVQSPSQRCPHCRRLIGGGQCVSKSAKLVLDFQMTTSPSIADNNRGAHQVHRPRFRQVRVYGAGGLIAGRLADAILKDRACYDAFDISG
jgi:hypothetical protein